MSTFLIARVHLVLSLNNISAMKLERHLSLFHTFPHPVTHAHKIHL